MVVIAALVGADGLGKAGRPSVELSVQHRDGFRGRHRHCRTCHHIGPHLQALTAAPRGRPLALRTS